MIALIVNLTVNQGAEEQTNDYIRKLEEHTRRDNKSGSAFEHRPAPWKQTFGILQ